MARVRRDRRATSTFVPMKTESAAIVALVAPEVASDPTSVYRRPERNPAAVPGADLLHHWDQGSTYASEDYQDILTAHGITCSMSRRGEVLDNAAMEAWNSTFKVECGERFETNQQQPEDPQPTYLLNRIEPNVEESL